MDIYCPRCGEPWDNDTIHLEVEERIDLGEAATYASVSQLFNRKGCGVAFTNSMGYGDGKACIKRETAAGSAAAALADLGLDPSEIGASLEDFGLV